MINASSGFKPNPVGTSDPLLPTKSPADACAGIVIRSQQDFEEHFPGNSYDPSISLSKNIVNICQSENGTLPTEGTFILEGFEYSQEAKEYADGEPRFCLPKIFVPQNARIYSGSLSFWNGSVTIAGEGNCVPKASRLGARIYPTTVFVHGESGEIHMKAANTFAHACGAGSKVIIAADDVYVEAQHPAAIIIKPSDFKKGYIATYEQFRTERANRLYNLATYGLDDIEGNPIGKEEEFKLVLQQLARASKWGHAEAEWSYEEDVVSFEQANQSGYVDAKNEPTFRDRLFVTALRIKSHQGEAKASLYLGLMALRGEKGVKQSYDVAIDHFERAEKQYDDSPLIPAGQPVLTYQEVRILKKQLMAACNLKTFQELNQKANNKHPKIAGPALHELGMCYLNGKYGLPINEDTAFEYFGHAAKYGVFPKNRSYESVSKASSIGYLLGYAASSKQLSDICFAKAEKGNVASEIKTNRLMGLFYLNIAAHQGSVDAAYKLVTDHVLKEGATFYKLGKENPHLFLPENDKKIQQLVQTIYDKQTDGNTKAIMAFSLGELCMKNSWKKNDANFQEAINWYEKAEKNHHVGAAARLAAIRESNSSEQTNLNSDAIFGNLTNAGIRHNSYSFYENL